jgi:hypothetical protein
MAHDKNKQAYRVRCWGACAQAGAPLCGIDYPTRGGQVRRVEGEDCSDIPVQSIRGELEAGHIEAIEPVKVGKE